MLGQSNQVSKRLQQLLDVMTDSVIFFDDQNRVAECYAGESRWLDATKLIGCKLEDLFSEDLAKQLILSGQERTEQELALRPESHSVFREAGLHEVIWVRITFLHEQNSGASLLMRDISNEKKLARQVTSQSQRDPLTGAYHRRALRPVLNQAVAQAQRYDWVCSLLLVDVDGFKHINETFSWDGGDQVLQQLVNGLHRLKRTADFLARSGDNQIALYFPETNREQALLAANRVLSLARNMEVNYAVGDIHFTVSIGIATLNGLEDDAGAMIERAENNLFIAKQSGGDRAEADVD